MTDQIEQRPDESGQAEGARLGERLGLGPCTGAWAARQPHERFPELDPRLLPGLSGHPTGVVRKPRDLAWADIGQITILARYLVEQAAAQYGLDVRQAS